MAVRWPDGSYTGSVRVSKQAPASPPVEPVPDTTTEPVKASEKKEADYGPR